MKKLFAIPVCLLLIMGFAAGCNSDQESATASTTGVITPSTTQTKPVLDSETPLVLPWLRSGDQLESPGASGDYAIHHFMMWEQLFGYDDSHITDNAEHIVWKLADGYVRSEDCLSVTYTLREGIQWSDGTPITAADVEFSCYGSAMGMFGAGDGAFQKLAGYADFISGKTANISGITTADRSITFTLVKADPNFHWNVWVMPKHCFDGLSWNGSADAPYWKAPVTSGPYKFVDAQFPNRVNLTRNEHYYGAPAGVKHVSLVAAEDVVSAAVEGTCDLVIQRKESVENSYTVTPLPGSVAKQISKENPDYTVRSMYSDKLCWLMFNMGNRTDGKDKKIFIENPNARRAISLLVNEETIAESVAGTACRILGNPNHPQVTHRYDKNDPPQDLQQAKQLLEAAGWNFDDELDILSAFVGEEYTAVLERIREDAAKIGVKIKIHSNMTPGSAAQLISERNYDLVLAGVNGRQENPFAGLEELGSDASLPCMAQCDWVIAKYNGLLKTARSYEEGSDAFMAAMNAAAEANFQDCLIIPLYAQSSVVCYNAARVFIPDAAFDYNDQNFRFEDWRMQA